MIVADTNTLAYLWLASNHAEEVEAILAEDHNWCVPYVWRSEFRSILMKYVKAKIYTLPQSIAIINKAEEFLLGKEYKIESADILTLSYQSGCSSYDCEYVALAFNLKTKLITYNQKIIKQFPYVAMTGKQYLESISK
jgi:predicted nucleic acid-binding protein